MLHCCPIFGTFLFPPWLGTDMRYNVLIIIRLGTWCRHFISYRSLRCFHLIRCCHIEFSRAGPTTTQATIYADRSGIRACYIQYMLILLHLNPWSRTLGAYSTHLIRKWPCICRQSNQCWLCKYWWRVCSRRGIHFRSIQSNVLCCQYGLHRCALLTSL